jgi:hypothetical protein
VAGFPRKYTWHAMLLRSLDDEAQSLHLTPGWDDITGVGSPNGAGYVLSLGSRGR